jgi:hypothetical protein
MSHGHALGPAGIPFELFNTFRSIDIEGLVLSWDLWHIPEERLKLIRSLWLA